MRRKGVSGSQNVEGKTFVRRLNLRGFSEIVQYNRNSYPFLDYCALGICIASLHDSCSPILIFQFSLEVICWSKIYAFICWSQVSLALSTSYHWSYFFSVLFRQGIKGSLGSSSMRADVKQSYPLDKEPFLRPLEASYLTPSARGKCCLNQSFGSPSAAIVTSSPSH